jgi:Family of unknown function (DUF6283)
VSENRAASTSSPGRRPCGSCPYRRDVPSGIWCREEYEKLPPYDGATWEQPAAAFFCHQRDGRLCAGWVAVHDMQESLGLRLAQRQGLITAEDAVAALEYETDVPVFASGAEACEHGLRDLDAPTREAGALISKLERAGRAT